MNRDKLHLKAPGAWINDPNGFIYYKGNYHMFYQYFPYAPRWGTMHWGHAVSKDLVNWEHKGVALFPTLYEDQNGCFSGSAVEHQGRMYLCYTGVHYFKTDPEDIHHCLDEQFEASQLMISSEDGFQFDNFGGKKVVIPPIEDPQIGDRTHTRDPKVWRGENGWYMVLGSNDGKGHGRLLFYKSEDLEHWTYVNGSTGGEGQGRDWECPDYFKVFGGEVLMLSSIGVLKDGCREDSQVVCTLVNFDERDCSMAFPKTYQYMDYGFDLYASQSTLDKAGRRVMVAWLRMPEAVDRSWNGMFCLPRVVEVERGHIYFRVHPNVERQYSRRLKSAAEAGEAGYKVSLELKDEESVNIGGYRIWRAEGKIFADRRAVFCDREGYRLRFCTPKVRDGYHLDVYVDRNMVEVFVNRGEYVISNAVYGMGDEIERKFEGELVICGSDSI